MILRNSFRDSRALECGLPRGCRDPKSLGASAFRQQSRVSEKQGSIKRLKPALYPGPAGSIQRAWPGGHTKAISNSKNEFGA